MHRRKGHAHLLVSLAFIHIVPHMAPALEAAQHIWPELQDEECAEHSRRHSKHNRADAAGAHKGNEQKCDKEDAGRAEVSHEKQTHQADPCKGKESSEVLLRLQPIQRGSAHEDKGNLDKLGRLKRN